MKLINRNKENGEAFLWGKRLCDNGKTSREWKSFTEFKLIAKLAISKWVLVGYYESEREGIFQTAS